MVKPFVPELVYIEPRALEYPLGRELKEKFEGMGIEIRETTSHNQVRNLPGENDFPKVPDGEINTRCRGTKNIEVRHIEAVR